MHSKKPKNILLVEDEAIFALMETRSLKSFGYEVTTANTGEEAVNIALTNKNINLILMDINLGSAMDGTEAAINILEKRNIPIIFLTSHSEKEYVDKVREITRYGYVIKDSGDFVLKSSIEMAFELFEANEKAKEREEKLKKALSYAHIGSWTWDIKNDDLTWSDEMYDLFGVNKESFTGSLEKIIAERIHPDDRAKVKKANISVIKDKKPVPTEYRVIWPDNSVHHIWGEAGELILDEDGKPSLLIGFVQDTTERKKVEQELRRSELRLAEAERIGNTGSWEYEIASDTAVWSENMSRIFDIDEKMPKEFALKYFIENLVVPEDRDHTLSVFQDSLLGKRPFDIEYRIVKKNGEIRNIHALAETFFDEQGKATRMIGRIEDITEYRKTTDSLRETQLLLSETERIGKVGGWELNIDTNKVTFTEEGYHIHEADPGSEFTLQERINFFSPTSRPIIERCLQHAIEYGEPYDVELEIITSRGNLRHIHSIGKADLPHRRVYGFFQDITERKRAEEKTRETQLLLASSIESPKDMIILSIDKNYRYLYFNSVHKSDMFKAYGKDVAIGMNLLECITNDEDREKAKKNYGRALAGESHITVEEYGDLNRHYYESRFNPILNDKNEIIGATAFAYDITTRKLAEEQIKNLLAEKELILKEVHHRIRNNMGTVSLLLKLQMDRSENQSAKIVLQEAASLIQSMIVLYDKLYLSKNFESVSIKEYLPSLIDEIVSQFTYNRSVKTHVQVIDDVSLDPKLLSPLGLILNELITNSMKYAFKEETDGVITVTATKKETRLLVTFEDNGIGLPESITFENSTGFGMQLIGMLIKQIKASVLVERKNGTKFFIEFDTVQ